MVSPAATTRTANSYIVTIHPRHPKISNRIWDVVSAILFPIGLYRLTCHYVAKHIFSPFILASSSEFIRKKFEHEKIIKQTDLTRFKDVEASRIKHKLDGVEIRKAGNKKWLIYVLPTGAIWQQILETALLPLARESGRNVFCVNYRSTGANPLNRPSSFSDLSDDIESALSSLTDGLGEDPVFFGHSLGAASALKLANKYNTRAVAQNTFSIFENLATPYRKILHKSVAKGLEKNIETQQKQTLKFSLIDTFFSLPHLAIRVTYFFLSLIDNVVKLEGKKALLDLKEISKTILIDTVLTISGFISLILFPFTNKINQFNASLKVQYLTRSALLTFINSSKFIFLAKKILKSSGWTADNTEAALSLGKNRVFIVQAPYDQKLEHKYSLGYSLEKSKIPIHKFKGHNLDPNQCHHDYLASPATSRHETDQALKEFLE